MNTVSDKTEIIVDTLEKDASAWKRNFAALTGASKSKLIGSGILNHEKELSGLNRGSENIVKHVGGKLIDWGKDGSAVLDEIGKNMNSTQAGRYQQGSKLWSKKQLKNNVSYATKPSAGWVSMPPTENHPGLVSKGYKVPDLLGVNPDRKSLDNRYAEGVIFRHEADELRTAAKNRLGKKTGLEIGDNKVQISMTPQSHSGPSVIARESANVAIAPANVRKSFTKLRGRERLQSDRLGHPLNYGKAALPDAKAMKQMDIAQSDVNRWQANEVKKSTEEAMRMNPEPAAASEGMSMNKKLLVGGGLAAAGVGHALYGNLFTGDAKDKTKTAGILDYLATVQKDDTKTTLKVRHDNNMIQDAYQAFKGRSIDDAFSDERKKILVGTAAAALGAGLLIYNRGKAGELISKSNESAARTPFMNQVARRIGPVAMAAGLYGAYAHKDDEDKTSRNIALGVAGLGLVGGASIGAGATKGTMTSAEVAATLKKAPVILGSAGLLGAGLIHSTNAAQKMDDEAKVDELLHSKEELPEVTRKVNALREKKNIASRYPLTRIFNTVPILENAPHYSIGTPSGEMSPKDKALYIKYQKEN